MFCKKKKEDKKKKQQKETRQIVSIGLEARAKVGIKVRQPLQAIKVKSQKLKASKEYFDLIPKNNLLNAIQKNQDIKSFLRKLRYFSPY